MKRIWVVVVPALLLLSFVYASAQTAADSGDEAVEYNKKKKVKSADWKKRYSGDGKRRYYTDANGKKHRVEKFERPTKNESIAFELDLTNEDAEGKSPVPGLAVPKAVKKFAAYYNRRGGAHLDPNALNAKPRDAVSHKDKQTMVSDQALRGTCVSFASTAALEAATGSKEKLSAEYMFWLLKDKNVKAACDENKGSSIFRAAEVLRKQGVPNDATYPYLMMTVVDAGFCQTAPNALAKDRAVIRPQRVYYYPSRRSDEADARAYAKKNNLEYVAPDSSKHGVTVDNPRFLEAVVDAGYDMVIAVEAVFPDEFAAGDVTDVTVDEDQKPLREEGGHAMLLVGYERTPGKNGGGYFLVKNSWGVFNSGGGYVKLSYDFMREYAWEGMILDGQRKGELGDKCFEPAFCKGFEGLGKEGNTCCGGVCTALEKDWAGVYYCPNECVGRSGASAGTCPLKNEGEQCKVHADCDDWEGLGKKGNACCGGKCTDMMKDFAGVYYCPNECRGGPVSGAGTCTEKNSKSVGDKCTNDGECKKSDCCGGKCAKKKRDWAGVKYCPNECVGKIGGKAGSCK